MSEVLSTIGLSVGYAGKTLIRDIDFSLKRGQVLTLIGPNGAGKSTILKTLTRHLAPISGTVYIEREPMRAMRYSVLAKKMSVVLTERVHPELMTCYEVVAAGRYPYAGRFGVLTERDHAVVRSCLERVHAEDIAEQFFDRVSDGQRQRIMLARALAQEPEIIVLDEPTSFLDIRYKIDLLNILVCMAREHGLTVILSLHEIELAAKISDIVMCVKGETIERIGTPEDVFTPDFIRHLYDLDEGSYNVLFGSTELMKPVGKPEVFVVGGCGYGIPIYRELQRRRTPFAAGILFENDLDVPVAAALSDHVVLTPAFQPIGNATFEQAVELMIGCKRAVDAGAPVGEFNVINTKLFALAKSKGIPVSSQSDKGGA